MSEEKFPVWEVESDYNYDGLTWIVPFEKHEENPDLGGGLKELMTHIDTTLEYGPCDTPDDLDKDGEKIMSLSVKWMTKKEIAEINVIEA